MVAAPDRPSRRMPSSRWSVSMSACPRRSASSTHSPGPVWFLWQTGFRRIAAVAHGESHGCRSPRGFLRARRAIRRKAGLVSLWVHVATQAADVGPLFPAPALLRLVASKEEGSPGVLSGTARQHRVNLCRKEGPGRSVGPFGARGNRGGCCRGRWGDVAPVCPTYVERASVGTSSRI